MGQRMLVRYVADSDTQSPDLRAERSADVLSLIRGPYG